MFVQTTDVRAGNLYFVKVVPFPGHNATYLPVKVLNLIKDQRMVNGEIKDRAEVQFIGDDQSFWIGPELILTYYRK